MAINQDKKPNRSLISKFTQSISDKISDLRVNTTFLPANITDDTRYITKNINDSINSLVSHNEEISGQVNMANIYNRLANDNMSDDGKSTIDAIFNSKQLSEQVMPNFIQNKQLLEYEEIIDTIVKYFPTMQDVLNVKKDHVLCADHNTKDFINVLDTVTSSSNDEDRTSAVQKNVQYIKDKYDLINQFDKFYDITAKYGECFIYIKGYDAAIGELLKQKEDKNNNRYVSESANLNFNNYFDSANNGPISLYKDADKYDKLRELLNEVNFNININEGPIQSYIKESTDLRKIITEQEMGYKSMDKSIVPNQLGFEGLNDGLIDTGNLKKPKSKKNMDNPKLDLKGCIVRRLKRENILPLFFEEDTVGGYFYIECDYAATLLPQKNGLNALKGNMANMTSIFNNMRSSEKKDIMGFVADKVSDMIDAKFVTNNQDLKKEIYLILKNSNMLDKGKTTVNVTYISPADVVHMKFDEDPVTHRGVSDLDKSIVPASMYVNLYTTNTIGILTRGFDKRVYYVKNRVDTNISRTLLSVMNQLKRGNMGVREISNPKTSLGISGRFNDTLIPVGQSGDAPVTMENMPGQDIDTKPELMETLKELAVGPTDVPLDYVDQSKSVDFATRLTMSSYKLLRAVYKRQGQTNPFFTMIFQKIYDYEFDDENDPENHKSKLKVTLPSPVYINQMGVAEVYRVVNDYSTGLADAEFVDPNDTQTDIKKKLFIREHNKLVMGSQLDRNILSQAKDYAKLEAAKFVTTTDDNQSM